MVAWLKPWCHGVMTAYDSNAMLCLCIQSLQDTIQYAALAIRRVVYNDEIEGDASHFILAGPYPGTGIRIDDA